MSDQAVAITPDRIQRALEATFAGKIPAWIDDAVDRSLCAEHIDDTKIGFFFAIGDDEQPRVRLSCMKEADRLREKVVARWPQAAEIFEKSKDPYHMIFDVGADDTLLIATFEVTETDDGFEVTGDALELPSGRELPLTTYTEAPLDKVSGPMHDKVKGLVDAGAKGQWHIRWEDGAPEAVLWVTERPWTPEAGSIVSALGGGPKMKALREVLTEGGQELDPFLVEVRNTGEVHVLNWGVGRPVERNSEARAFFDDGGVARADVFAERIALTVPVAEQEEAAVLAAEELFPAILATRSDDMELIEHVDASWTWLVGRLADEPPFERLDLLRTISARTRLSAIGEDAFGLAAARYIASHPDATLPDSVRLPVEVATAEVAELQQRAKDLLEAAEPLIAHVQGVDDDDLNRIPHVELILVEIKDTLERVISGDFTAAEGRLHALFTEMGPGGYDDDPSLASLEDIDLDANATDAAIEEALALDDDDEW